MRASVADEWHVQGEKAPEAVLPLCTSTSRGRARWYLVRCPEGRERALCKELCSVASASLLADAFVPCMEREVRDEGRWRKSVVPVFPGYFVAVSDDPVALQRQILEHTYPVYVAGRVGDGFAPMADEAKSFLESVMDRHRVIRFSDATVDGRGLHVESGPLVGKERRIASFESGERHVRVSVLTGAEGAGAFGLDMPIRMRVAAEDAKAEGVGSVAKAGVSAAPRRVVSSLPLSRRTPKGRLRWYLVECPEGSEESLCHAVREAVPRELLADAYVPKTEVLLKVRGEWTKPVRQLFAGRFAVCTADAAALGVRLRRAALPVRLAGAEGGGYAPVEDEAWAFLESCMDSTRTIRESRGEIVGDELRVQSGPLAGRESRVTRYVRRHSIAFVDMGEDASGPHAVLMPLAILARR